MQVISPNLISGKKVLLRLDIDVPLDKGRIADDFRLQAGLPTLKLCLEHAKEVVVMGHLGRPGGKEVPELSIAPIYDWYSSRTECGKLSILENLRFEAGEEAGDLFFAKELASLGEVFINEAFASYHPAASTTVLPTLLPHAAGLQFAQEVEILTRVKENPNRPLIAIVGGLKVDDKLPAVRALSKIADVVLVGGKLAGELKKKPGLIKELGEGVVLGELNKEGSDLTSQTIEVWKQILMHHSAEIIWNGPVGQVEDPKNDQSKYLAEAVISSGVKTIIGGGDTVGFLQKLGLIDKFSFVSTGGGAMLEFLIKGTLPTIQVLG